MPSQIDIFPRNDEHAWHASRQRTTARPFPGSNSEISPLRIIAGAGGQPRMCKSTGTTFDTPPATA
jgi:hypothetical protein